MLQIGLTGGIGSGKTTIANIFSTLGVAIYDADSAAKNLMNTNLQIRQQLTELFGADTYKEGQLNRAFLSSKVFNNAPLLAELNAITHPITIQDSIDWFNRQQGPYAIKEAALIFESGSNKHLDYTIGVWAEKELRIERVLERGGLDRAAILARMEKQMDESEKMKRCDFVIDNNGEKSVIAQVFELHQTLVNLADR
ncbi:dephospho-CoA kinase [Niabella hibiscisoli]|uniref:dephospho-CoA kinase n=1 Tax=Niabella hibiscisoli TaxID=1825928 RepID=UPI001F0F9FC8|nr:dephospho-CoA kinase [Niabella hibiscisoli]MCH5721408.1 dephospho-CoA kinase [Niabella hibiscisoli]